MDKIIEELKHLTAIPAVSGHEDKILFELYHLIKPLADEVSIDRIGNLTVTINGRLENEPTLLLFAHVDEIGLMVRKIEDNGFLRFERIGGLPEKTLLGQFVDIYSIDKDSSITGVIGTISHHLTPADKKYSIPDRLGMYIDLGLRREEVLARGIDIGSIVTYHHNFKRISKNRITSKALDNRVGVHLLLRLIKYLKTDPPTGTVYIVFSVQEEFNVRGLLPVFEKLKPNASICIDITPACDTPDLNMIYNIELGKGPAITQMNFHGRGTLGGIIPNPKLRRFIELVAEDLKLPYQREVIVGVITDDSFTQMTGTEGVAMGHISVPLRYTHSPIETADLRDIEACSKLLNEIVKRFNKQINIDRGL